MTVMTTSKEFIDALNEPITSDDASTLVTVAEEDIVDTLLERLNEILIYAQCGRIAGVITETEAAISEINAFKEVQPPVDENTPELTFEGSTNV